MGDWSVQQLVFALAVGAFCLTAAFWDFRTHKVPNWLTVPMFVGGWGFQYGFAGWNGVAEAATAFALGFGTLFLLWLMGSGGGGDVKLVGALSVWLGLRMTILVMVVSSLMVLLGTLLLMAGFLVGRTCGRRSASTEPGDEPPIPSRRRVMAYAIPVAFATWAVMAFELPPL